MSFDARSLERLQQLGRSLPKPLPKPEPPPSAATRASEKRHRVETETDPEALFRELMQVSPDGSVPPHLLDRLRQAEADRVRAQQAAQRQGRPAATTTTGPAGERRPNQRPNPQRRQPASDEELELYTAFQQLLLEDDED
jgi:hypothetical protein